jgi:alpha-tubulin suppressor-like RCC1 family protein
VTSPIAQLLGHATGFYGPLHNLGALSAWGTSDEPSIGIASGPDNFCSAFIGFDGNGVKRAYSRMSTVVKNQGWKTVSAGFFHSLGIRSDGSLYAWGFNRLGQLGQGNTMDKNVPARVGTKNDWVAVSAGEYHSLALRTDGSLWAWGSNSHGQLGLGDEVTRHLPARVGTWNDWIVVAAGRNYSFGIRADGSLWAWGGNDDGQLGVGNITDRNVPTRVGIWHTWNDWVAIDAGDSHSLGIRANGSLYAWGENDEGALGLGGISQVTAPTQVGSLQDWKLISAGEDHSLGLRGGDLMYAWGENTYGQLGLNDTSDRDTPVKVGTSFSWDYWKAISAGDLHSLGIQTDKSLWAWGSNSTGQLGVGGDPAYRNKPVKVGVWNDWQTVSAGSSHSLGIRMDGSLWAWGWNRDGQLGLGDDQDRNTPSRILLPKKFPWPMFLPAIISGRK